MPIRTKLLDLLEAYCPNDDEQKKSKEQIKRFVISNEDCFLRSNKRGHITASSWLVSPDHSHVLLTHHKKIGRWIQLGGHADGDGDVFRVAKREALEESGMRYIETVDAQIFDVDIHEIKEFQEIPAHLHYDIRFVFRAADRFYRVSEESHDLAWVPIESLIKHEGNPSLRRMAQKWAEKLSN